MSTETTELRPVECGASDGRAPRLGLHNGQRPRPTYTKAAGGRRSRLLPTLTSRPPPDQISQKATLMFGDAQCGPKGDGGRNLYQFEAPDRPRTRPLLNCNFFPFFGERK